MVTVYFPRLVWRGLLSAEEKIQISRGVESRYKAHLMTDDTGTSSTFWRMQLEGVRSYSFGGARPSGHRVDCGLKQQWCQHRCYSLSINKGSDAACVRTRSPPPLPEGSFPEMGVTYFFVTSTINTRNVFRNTDKA